jgi:drug/metabolite transporter (DMT)-like permease
VHHHVPAGVGDFPLGAVVAVIAAAFFAVGSLLQQEASVDAVSGGRLDLRRLVTRPAWVVGQTATVLATLLQVVALALAPVSVVQPLLAAALVIALGLRALRDRRRPSGTELLGAALTVGGLAVFLGAARPAPGGLAFLPGAASVATSVLLAVVLVALASRAGHGPVGALLCGIAAGTAAGIAAVLVSAALKVSRVDLVDGSALAVLAAAGVVAVVAQLGSQQAYARGTLAWSLPAVIVVDPIAAIPTALLLVGERLEPGHAVVWGPAALVAVAGVVLLSRTQDHRTPAEVSA